MSYELDPELVTVMAALAEQSAATPAPARGDWKALRQAGEQGQPRLAEPGQHPERDRVNVLAIIFALH
jgi:hypothetical protein